MSPTITTARLSANTTAAGLTPVTSDQFASNTRHDGTRGKAKWK
jgi:hypothetical protein